MELLIFIILFSLTSCATSPTATTGPPYVSPSAILSSEYTKYDGAKPQVIIVRDTGITGSACSIRLFVNGTATANIDPFEKVELYLEEGEHILSIKYNGICGDGQLNEASDFFRPLFRNKNTTHGILNLQFVQLDTSPAAHSGIIAPLQKGELIQALGLWEV